MKIFLLLISPDPTKSPLSFMEFYEAGFVLYWLKDFEQAGRLLNSVTIDLIFVDADFYEESVVLDFCHFVRTKYPKIKLGLVTSLTKMLGADLPVDAVLLRETFTSNPIEELKRLVHRT